MEKIDISKYEAEWLSYPNFQDEPKSLIQFIMDDLGSKVHKERNDVLIHKVKVIFGDLGYFFQSELEFEYFFSKRITLIQEGNFSKSLYLDCISEKDRGIFLIRFSDEVSIDYSDLDKFKNSMDIKMTIG